MCLNGSAGGLSCFMTCHSHLPAPPSAPQGSSWDRSRRRFFIHNSAPPELEGELD